MNIKNNYYRFLALSLGSIAGTACLFSTAKSANALTFVLDFNEPGQANTIDVFGSPNEVSTFDVTKFGFADTTANFNTITNSVLETVESHFYDIPTIAEDSRSPIPVGQQLDIDFQIGDIGNTASITDTEFYFVQIGEVIPGSPNETSLGVAAGSAVRTSTGTANQFNISQTSINNKAFGSIFTNNIDNLSRLSPSNALTSGNLEFTTNAIAGTLSHEIGHTLSLGHVHPTNFESFNNLTPLMGTGAAPYGMDNQERINDRAFSFSALTEPPSANDEPNELRVITDRLISDGHGGDEAKDPFAPLAALSGDERPVTHVQQLVSAVGTRNTVAVPFEFSPGMGLFIVGSTWGVASWRRRKQGIASLKDN